MWRASVLGICIVKGLIDKIEYESVKDIYIIFYSVYEIYCYRWMLIRLD